MRRSESRAVWMLVDCSVGTMQHQLVQKRIRVNLNTPIISTHGCAAPSLFHVCNALPRARSPPLPLRGYFAPHAHCCHTFGSNAPLSIPRRMQLQTANLRFDGVSALTLCPPLRYRYPDSCVLEIIGRDPCTHRMWMEHALHVRRTR